jgi:hypothetical protein
MELFATIARFSTPGSATTNLNKVLKKVKAAGLATPGSARKRKAGLLPFVPTTIALTDRPSCRGWRRGRRRRGHSVEDSQEEEEWFWKGKGER